MRDIKKRKWDLELHVLFSSPSISLPFHVHSNDDILIFIISNGIALILYIRELIYKII